MNKTIWSLLALSVFTVASVTAQDTKNKKNEERKEIIIEEKSSGKNEKMVIVIDGDNITINGKPADNYKGKKRIVIDDDISINGNEVHIPRKGQLYMHGFSANSNKALLGVVTDKADKGVTVKQVSKASAAEKAGLREGDIITKLNDKDIKAHEDLVASISKMKPNEVADITYLRDGKEKKTKATLGKSEAPMAMAWNMDNKNRNYEFRMNPPMAMNKPRAPKAPNAPRAPFIFNDGDMWMFRSDKPRYGMGIEDNADGDGVKITSVDSASNAMKAGIKENDIITEVEGKPIKGTDNLREALDDIEDKSTINVKVLRNGATESLVLRVPKVIKKGNL